MSRVSISSLVEGHAAAPIASESISQASRKSSAAPVSSPVPVSNFDLNRDALVSAVEAGCLTPTNAYGDVAPWPTSATSGRSYHGSNVLLLAQRAAEKGYDSGAWCTFDAAKSRGWSVRKGEQHTKVFFFSMASRDTGEVDEETGDPIMETYPRLVHHKVFNVAQLELGDGQPVAEPVGAMLPRSRVPTNEAVHALERIADAMGVDILHDASLKRPAVTQDRITLPNPTASRDPAAVSDLARSLLQVAIVESKAHESRRPSRGAVVPEQVDAETKLRVAMAEAMLSMRLGFPLSKGADSFDPGLMATAFSGGKNVGMRSAKAAEKAVTYLLSFDPELHDDLVDEARAVHDEILDAGGDPVVFDGSQIDFGYVAERNTSSPRP